MHDTLQKNSTITELLVIDRVISDIKIPTKDGSRVVNFPEI